MFSQSVWAAVLSSLVYRQPVWKRLLSGLKRSRFNISASVCVTNLLQISALFGSLKVWDNICNIRWRSLEPTLLFVAHSVRRSASGSQVCPEQLVRI